MDLPLSSLGNTLYQSSTERERSEALQRGSEERRGHSHRLSRALGTRRLPRRGHRGRQSR